VVLFLPEKCVFFSKAVWRRGPGILPIGTDHKFPLKGKSILKEEKALPVSSSGLSSGESNGFRFRNDAGFRNVSDGVGESHTLAECPAYSQRLTFLIVPKVTACKIHDDSRYDQ
jgi:hypothetical protein